MEEKVLYNVLRKIGTGKESDAAPDKEYIKALVKIGLISVGWDNTITKLGKSILDHLRNKIEKW